MFSIFFAVDCGRSEHHCSAPPELKSEAGAAASIWNAVSNEPIFIDDGDDCEIVLTYDIPHSSPTVIGLYKRNQDRIYVDRDVVPGRDRIMVLAHEMGHLIEIEHHGDYGLMNVAGLPMEAPLELSAADRAECRRVNKCL